LFSIHGHSDVKNEASSNNTVFKVSNDAAETHIESQAST